MMIYFVVVMGIKLKPVVPVVVYYVKFVKMMMMMKNNQIEILG